MAGIPLVQTPVRALLRRWQTIAVTRGSQRGHKSQDECEWRRNEVRWIFDHFATSSVSSSRDERSRIANACKRLLLHHEPIAYILRSQPFGTLPSPLHIQPPLLIPRPETEEWTLRLATLLSTHLAPSPSSHRINMLDLCTGSGCIALQLAHTLHSLCNEQHQWQVIGVDISPIAIQVANINASRLQLPPNSLHFHQADLFNDEQIDPFFHLVFSSSQPRQGEKIINILVSNPPYITPHDFRHTLDSSIRDFEDPAALIGTRPRPSDNSQSDSHTQSEKTTQAANDDQAGLAFYRRIAALCSKHSALLISPSSLSAQGPSPLPTVVLEVGKGQAQAVADIFAPFASTMLSSATVKKRSPTIQSDAWGVERVVLI
ncbi:hypothetical protein V8E36_006731 [Tilletia maclaganii]